MAALAAADPAEVAEAIDTAETRVREWVDEARERTESGAGDDEE